MTEFEKACAVISSGKAKLSDEAVGSCFFL